MSISRLTAYVIATNPAVKIETAGPCCCGKYAGFILLDPEKVSRFEVLLSTEPHFSTPEDARAAMQKVIDECRELVRKEAGDQDPAAALIDDAFKVEKTITGRSQS